MSQPRSGSSFRRSPAAVSVVAAVLFAGPLLPAQSAPDLSGGWVFDADRTPASASGTKQPNNGPRFDVAKDADVLLFTWPSGVKRRVYRFALDGTPEEWKDGRTTSRHSGKFEGERFVVSSTSDAPGANDAPVTTVSRRTYTRDGDALRVELVIEKPTPRTVVSVYRRTTTTAPVAIAATIDALGFLAGTWKGEVSGAEAEESWTPPAGGAMLATSRILSRGRMVMFEYLRIVEREGTLVYIAQPNGRPPSDFVLTKIDPRGAVFENPDHDFPQRIRYALAEDGTLSATISDHAGTKSETFRFRRAAGG